ncbi:MAG: hypothetical protein QF464_04645 [Myxococcota bacterium]|jgi:hypothetical protein|nr:hypothetical protein [Myxococcota bacterium]
MRRLIVITLALFGMACGSSPATDGDALDVTGDTTSIDVTTEEVTPTGCDPGTATCVDPTSWATCGSDGSPGEAVACGDGTVCDAGQCRGSLCAGGETRCASWTVHRTCEDGGTRWGPPTSCGVDEICHDGQCLTCFPGHKTCATLVASAVCGDDGLSFPIDDIISCPTGENCHEPTGICLAPTCTADETACSGALGYHTCLGSETQFSPEITPCATGETCANSVCSPATCAPYPVLFVVDRTGAFDEDWDAYRAAIETATADHPHALYGFMPFPMAFGCPDPGAGDLPRFPSEADADIDAWFDTVPKSSGKAALQHVLQTVLDRTHELFVGNGGRVVLISSGSADCGSDADAIGAIVASLRLDHDVRTYVIGHRASQGLYPALDAAHAQGGSGWDDWEETSYELDLTTALTAALSDVPGCD